MHPCYDTVENTTLQWLGCVSNCFALKNWFLNAQQKEPTHVVAGVTGVSKLKKKEEYGQGELRPM